MTLNKNQISNMDESEEESSPSPPSQLVHITDLLQSVGYNVDDHHNSDLPEFDKLFAGLAWCISSLNVNPKIDTVEDIEDALQSIGCPCLLKVSQIENVDYVAIYPAVEWLVSLIKTERHGDGYMNEKKAALLNELQLLKERIDKEGISDQAEELASLLKTSKALERQRFDFQSVCDKRRSGLLHEITELEKKLSNATDDKDLYDYIDHLTYDLSKKLNLAKQELSSKLRESVSLKRQLDDLPIKEEVAQYEQRFSELNAHMQDRLHRTRKYYATYNALLEIKDLMQKEISLLNSLDSQFEHAIGNPAGPMKLIDAMEAILKGTRQKLDKVQPGLHAEQKAFDTIREQYTVAIANQRRCSALLKAFQEECRKNERLKDECAKYERLRGQSSIKHCNQP